MDPVKIINEIKNKDELGHCIFALYKDLKSNPEQWENCTIDSFLEAMHACASSVENEDSPPWKRFGEILYMAKQKKK